MIDLTDAIADTFSGKIENDIGTGKLTEATSLLKTVHGL